MHFGVIISLIALGLGALMGLVALFNPTWASNTVRLVESPDPAKPGGYSEFRATYGGLFLFSHLTSFVMLLTFSRADASPILGLMAVVPMSAAWFGASVGRVFSLLLDGNQNRGLGLNHIWVPFELLFGLAIIAPLLQFMGN
jgi:hypothetical protein